MLHAIGLMSGTSLDGVDVALIESDGISISSFGPTGFRPYDDEERALLRRALADAASLADRKARPGALREAEALVTEAHAEAVERFLAAYALRAREVDVVGFHGQTVIHRPERRLTVQIGDGAALARRLGIRTVHDLRAADVAAGGQGAPFVPVFHQALVRRAGLAGPVAVLNVGGVANVTWIDADAPPIACDTGPGNALIDDFMFERTGAGIDRDGAAAARGRVDPAALDRLMAHPYFAQRPPKSLDRNAFSREAVSGLATEDGAATLTAFTARSVAAIIAHLPAAPALWIVCGGGARNPTLLRMLARETGADVRTAEDFGWSAEALEAQAFAFLAVRSLAGLPLTFPTTTGVAEPLSGGVLAEP
ncbi:anhydro-N-acetylmuramic acid kinase [Chelatococcus sp. SYSU_G07232]|uniref:Anhydro-N-acetylmuramic acid kinase n=1 Tax=Chelatococcus albus TaxID=3047466 RepID=A0ABT7ADM0_9HYPH|nr:anhydro-N-acetylmuramic acid kinase [Chelatococcus sp. SYSU_G07232]MDJ1156716.1 anhydro-N-acetylmuramic acid kinase [Chelatococcus sp. SYSU_G07232]